MTDALLQAYFDRIGYHGEALPSLSTLHAIVQAHASAIPFENLDVLLGRPIDLSAEALVGKLVGAGRGGYCFEQNGLLLDVLTSIGYAVRPLSARVRYQRPRDFLPPRTHLFLSVEVDGESWMADVGVGALSLTSAIRLMTEAEQETPHERRRLVREGSLWFHQAQFAGAWHDVSEFTLEEMPPIDRELANWYTSAHPQSHFRNRLVAARALTAGGRLTLLNRELTERGPAGIVRRVDIQTPEQLRRVLADEFGLHFDAGTTFTCPALDWPSRDA